MEMGLDVMEMSFYDMEMSFYDMEMGGDSAKPQMRRLRK